MVWQPKASISATDCPSQHRSNVPDLKNMARHKNRLHKACAATKPKSRTYASKKLPWLPRSLLQYFATRKVEETQGEISYEKVK
jgi:hypothetical protein